MQLPDEKLRKVQRFVVDGSAPSRKEDLLGNLAVTWKYITFPQLQGALRDLKSCRKEGKKDRLGEVLLRRNLVTGSELQEMLLIQERRRRAKGDGMHVGRYLLKRVVGQGGMAVVYEAEDPNLGRSVALKVIRQERGHPRVLARFQREAAILAKARHPGIVTIHDYGTARDHRGEICHFIAMELVHGETLNCILERKKTSRDELLRILEDLARAVGAAHSLGIVHRDLKPGNVLVDGQGRVVLTDFGLASAEWCRSSLTRTQAVMGTPRYMAPEQVEGRNRDIDRRTDVFALGLILYEILTGDVPFVADTVSEQYRRIVCDQPAIPKRLQGTDLQKICVKALEKEQADRYADAHEFAEELSRHRRGEPVRARATGAVTHLVRLLRKCRFQMLAVLGGIGLTAVFVALILSYRAESRRIAETQERERRASRLLDEAEFELDQATRALNARDGHFASIAPALEKIRCRIDETVDEGAAHPRGSWLLGRVFELQGQMESAESCYRRTLSLDPNHRRARFQLGRLLLIRTYEFTTGVDADVWERERTEGERLAQEAAESIEATTLFGSDVHRDTAAVMAAYVRQDWERGRELARKALERHASSPDSADLSWLAGLLALQSDERLAYFDRAILHAPGHVPALFSRGNERKRQGKISEALQDYDRAVELNPAFVRAFHNRGELRLRASELELADADFSKALDLDPRFYPARIGRGMVRFRRGNLPGALREYDWALEIEPESAVAHVERGRARRAAGDVSGAILDWEIAVARRPRPSSDVWQELGEAYGRLRQWDDAIRVYTDAIRRCPEAWQHRQNRGAAYAEKGELSAALEDYDEVLRLASGRPDPRARAMAQTGKGHVSLRLNRLADSLRQAESAILEDPGYAGGYMVRAVVRLARLDPARALEDANRAAELSEGDCNVYFVRALILQVLGDRRGAIRDYEDALRLAPKDWAKRSEVESRLTEVKR